MLLTGRRAVALCLAAVTVLATACTGDDGEPSATSAESTPTPTKDTPAPDDVPTDARLVADPNGGRADCLAEVAQGDRVSLYDPTVLAHGDVTIVDAQITGDGVRLADAESVTVLAPVSNGPGVLVDDEWPLTLSETRPGAVDEETRQPLVGSTVTDGTRILPLVALDKTEAGDAVAEALVLTYRAEGDETERTESLDLDLELAEGRCS